MAEHRSRTRTVTKRIVIADRRRRRAEEKERARRKNVAIKMRARNASEDAERADRMSGARDNWKKSLTDEVNACRTRMAMQENFYRDENRKKLRFRMKISRLNT